jgi:peptidyl-prolyl cis-trans isomerase SurA
MKGKLILAFALLLTTQLFAQKDEVILEIDGKKVTKSEFLQVYLKNNNSPKYDQQSLDEYMELYKKFRLKVAEAEALGYDTIPKLKKELAGYRKQLAQPYLIDSTENVAMVNQAYERLKSEIRASHILIKLNETATPADTLAAWNKIMGLKKRIEAGEDFKMVAMSKNGSEDPSVSRNGGDLGYFTAFQMVYPFEEAAYTTPVGKVSNPVRTKFGYHILKVVDVRPARGTMKAAHIMIATSKEATAEQVESARKKSMEIYAKLQNGESFTKLASEYSDDTQTAEKGGELQLFGSGTNTRMVPEFEDAAFALKNNGDFSLPIQTTYGFHIIKRLDVLPLKSFDELKKEIQAKVNKDERSQYTQTSFVNKLKKQYGHKDKFKKTSKWFVANIDSTYFTNTWNADNLKSDKTMFTIGKKAFTQQQFASYLEMNMRGAKKVDNGTLVKRQYQAWQKAEILAYEESKLEGKYPEFKALMQEYHDGILLYEVMTDKVWNRAIKDTSGLQEYFAKNSNKYVWGQRYNCYIYECKDEAIAADVNKMLLSSDTISSKTIIEKINATSELNLKVKTGKYEGETTASLKGQQLAIGVNKPYKQNDKVYVVKVMEILKPGPKQLSEAKGPATSDYQNYLEQEWLNELAKKHPITINKEVLYSLGK